MFFKNVALLGCATLLLAQVVLGYESTARKLYQIPELRTSLKRNLQPISFSGDVQAIIDLANDLAKKKALEAGKNTVTIDITGEGYNDATTMQAKPKENERTDNGGFETTDISDSENQEEGTSSSNVDSSAADASQSNKYDDSSLSANTQTSSNTAASTNEDADSGSTTSSTSTTPTSYTVVKPPEKNVESPESETSTNSASGGTTTTDQSTGSNGSNSNSDAQGDSENIVEVDREDSFSPGVGEDIIDTQDPSNISDTPEDDESGVPGATIDEISTYNTGTTEGNQIDQESSESTSTTDTSGSGGEDATDFTSSNADTSESSTLHTGESSINEESTTVIDPSTTGNTSENSSGINSEGSDTSENTPTVSMETFVDEEDSQGSNADTTGPESGGSPTTSMETIVDEESSQGTNSDSSGSDSAGDPTVSMETIVDEENSQGADIDSPTAAQQTTEENNFTFTIVDTSKPNNSETPAENGNLPNDSSTSTFSSTASNTAESEAQTQNVANGTPGQYVNDPGVTGQENSDSLANNENGLINESGSDLEEEILVSPNTLAACNESEMVQLHEQVLEFTYSLETNSSDYLLVDGIRMQVEEIVNEFLAIELLSCYNEAVQPPTNLGFEAIDSLPKDSYSTTTGCEATEGDSNDCTVFDGKLTLFTSEVVDSEYVKYYGLSEVRDALDSLSSEIEGLVKATYLGPSIINPAAIGKAAVSPNEAQLSRPVNSTSIVLFAVGGCAFAASVGLIYYLRRHGPYAVSGAATQAAGSDQSGRDDGMDRPLSPFSEMLPTAYRFDDGGNMSAILELDDESATQRSGILISDSGFTTEEEGSISLSMDGQSITPTSYATGVPRMDSPVLGATKRQVRNNQCVACIFDHCQFYLLDFVLSLLHYSTILYHYFVSY